MITSRGKTRLNEETIASLDFAEIVDADLIINPYQTEVNGKAWVSAYLQTLFATIREDELEAKYWDVPEAGVHPDLDEPGLEEFAGSD